MGEVQPQFWIQFLTQRRPSSSAPNKGLGLLELFGGVAGPIHTELHFASLYPQVHGLRSKVRIAQCGLIVRVSQDLSHGQKIDPCVAHSRCSGVSKIVDSEGRYGSIQTLGLREFPRVFQRVLQKHPSCRYTIVFREMTRVVDARDAAGQIFYLRLRR